MPSSCLKDDDRSLQIPSLLVDQDTHTFLGQGSSSIHQQHQAWKMHYLAPPFHTLQVLVPLQATSPCHFINLTFIVKKTIQGRKPAFSPVLWDPFWALHIARTYLTRHFYCSLTNTVKQGHEMVQNHELPCKSSQLLSPTKMEAD